jgi:hypothetical protein
VPCLSWLTLHKIHYRRLGRGRQVRLRADASWRMPLDPWPRVGIANERPDGTHEALERSSSTASIGM